MKKMFLLLTCLALAAAMPAAGQQVSDPDFNPLITAPAYAPGGGPVVFIDEGHNNFHTRDGRYQPFAKVLTSDGYRVEAYPGAFTAEKLREGSILVISNALNAQNVQNWYKPVLPAFTAEEIETVRSWVADGGSLFLIADHMPMGGAAAGLAAVFGFTFTDGFAVDTLHPGPTFFFRADATLADNIITDGRNSSERVDSIVSFTGQAFPVPDDATSFMQFRTGNTLLLSDTAWVFDKSTRRTDITGWSQAAYKSYGKGRVVVCGEAAMFSAQLAGPQKMKAGMNSPFAPDNYQLLLNIIHWLDRLTGI